MGKFSTFVIGGIIGAAAGLLFSPRTGAENRAIVADKINENGDITGVVQEKAGQVVDAAASVSTKVINTTVDKGQEVYRTVTTRVQQATPDQASEVFVEKGDDLREKIDAARERIATQVAKNAEAVHDAAMDKVPAAADAVKSATAAAKDAVGNATASFTRKEDSSDTQN